MMSTSARSSSRFPFTATQWQELEHQALIFKYMVSGMPIPPDLLYTIRSSFDSSLSSKLLLHQPHHIGWNCFQMGFGRKIDPEPGRCRRTDGKKWRCSKEAYPDSKYCERHMHRGRNRSRKPVEVITTATLSPNSTTTSTPPTAIPISSITKNSSSSSPSVPSSPTSRSFSCLTSLASESHHHHMHNHHHNHHHRFLYPHSSLSRPPGSHDLSSTHENPTTNFLLEPNDAYNSHAAKGYSGYGQGCNGGEVDEHAFFSETSSRTMIRSSSLHDSWQLTMGLPLPLTHLKQRSSYSGSQSGNSCYLQLQNQSLNDATNSSRRQKQDHQHYYSLGNCDVNNDMPNLTIDRDQDQPKKIMHHFFDEWPHKERESWLHDTDDDKLSSHVPVSKVQLSISMPNSSHDFFITRNEK